MSERLSHTDIEKVLRGAAEAKAVNLDIPVRQILDSVAPVLRDVPTEVNFHIICCDEYALVTE